MPFRDDGFIHLLRTQTARDFDGVYARFEGEPLSFGKLDRQASSFARHLRTLGIGAGERVAMMMRNSTAAIAVVFGLAKAGVAWVPINAQQRGEGLSHLLADSKPRLVVADAELVPLIEVARIGLPQLPVLAHGSENGLVAVLAASASFDEPVPHPDQAFAIMYTSGTTGRPKGVIVSHRMLRLASEAVSLVATVNDGDIFFVWEPLYHIGGAQLLPLPLLHSVHLAMVDRFSASRFWDQVRHEKATHIHYLGGILQILLKQPATPKDRMHGVRIAWGGGCLPDVWRPFRDRFGVDIRECYGMTEASSITTFNDSGVIGSVGQPVPWFTVALLDPSGVPVPVGRHGEIVVRTSLLGAIFPGYFGNADATAKALKDGALHTGDSGSFDAQGNLIFHGRMNDSVRCRGENISAWEVEHVAAAYDAIEDCAMIGVEAEFGEQEIMLFVQPKVGYAVDPAELSAWLGERLAPYQNPRYIVVVEEFERTASQRIMKHRLPRNRNDCFDRIAAMERRS